VRGRKTGGTSRPRPRSSTVDPSSRRPPLIVSDSAPFLAAEPSRLGVAKPGGRSSRVMSLVMCVSSSTDGRDSVECRRLVKHASASPYDDGLHGRKPRRCGGRNPRGGGASNASIAGAAKRWCAFRRRDGRPFTPIQGR
jgi:hypothetical protein